MRTEKDSMGEIQVDEDKYWGAQTERSRQNFHIGEEKMPKELIVAYARLKKNAAKANAELGVLSDIKSKAIQAVCDEIIAGKLDGHFPLAVWQTGSGTQTNMNVNEVIAHRGNMILEEQGKNEKLHPNDDVNKGQSSNDSFPSAMHISAYCSIEEQLLPVLGQMREVLAEKEKQFQHIVKIGRTHLQDATPLTLGQEISGWRTMIEEAQKMISESALSLLPLAIGGTAVGTGLNAHKDFGEKTAHFLKEETGYPFESAKNKFHSLTSHDAIVYVHGALKALSANAMKMANDVRWLASGPRCGIGELRIPANEPGSSIMPGKVNPTQCEAVTMIAAQVFGNDATISMAASQGNFQLNVFKPVIIYNFQQTVRLLSDGLRSFTVNCLEGIEAEEEKIDEYLHHSLMLVTAFNPHIGYEKAAEIAKLAYKDNLTLKEAALQLQYVTEEEFDQIIDPSSMV
ncbi:class II fumarate hydratase [Bacillus sp. 1P06AnD]|uniref:class II fumarate hydratase n=1 Tax=Bacillus sp. 1P06AnD TaxID=3132208 RepID=UPI0039A04D76